MTPSRVRIGVDIGGTFTDIVVAREDGTVLVSKVTSTPTDPGAAVVDGVAALLGSASIAPGAVIEVVHGTTVASNTILQHVGAPTGLLTTRGFRDVLEIGRIRTPDMFDLTWDKPVPLVERRHRLEIDERMGADGAIVRALDPESVVTAADRLVRDGITSVAICFINSYLNPAHEQEAERIVRLRHPSLDVTASWRVLPEIREYERTSTTVVNAYLLPVMRRYLAALAAGLRRIGIEAPLLVVASNGGVVGAGAAGERPVFAVGSGPAAGVVGAARLGEASGARDLIAFDMGGTTAKASLVEDGKVCLTSEYEFRGGISTSSRFIKAGGYMLKVPAIDIAEVGAGAGSIAWLDDGGLLRVGPQSAGAVPGPACYGIGGERPTVTDANVALGFLNPGYLAGGELRLEARRAHDAIRRYVAQPLGMSVAAAAHGIRQVANANMARAIRSVTIERGRDPREYALIAFGGSGPVHAVDVARALEIRRVLVPVSPGVFTAMGMLASDLQHHFVRAHAALLARMSFAAANKVIEEMARDARETLAAEGYTDAECGFVYHADLRYAGQGSELSVRLPDAVFDGGSVAALRTAFKAEYTTTYGYATDEDLELVNLRLVATGFRSHRLDFRRIDVTAKASAPGHRLVTFDRNAPPIDTPVVPREEVRALTGPAIVESYESTVVVPPRCEVGTDACGNLVISIHD
jgi:N-methylhydantoinase A